MGTASSRPPRADSAGPGGTRALKQPAQARQIRPGHGLPSPSYAQYPYSHTFWGLHTGKALSKDAPASPLPPHALHSWTFTTPEGISRLQKQTTKNSFSRKKNNNWRPYVSSSSHSAEEENQAQRGFMICTRSHGDVGRDNPEP